MPFKRIKLYASYKNDLIHWEDKGILLDASSDTSSWESQDVSSPILAVDSQGIWSVFYEGRKNSILDGAVGVATGPDLHHLKRFNNNPVVRGESYQNPNITWAKHGVCEGYFIMDGRPYITFSGYDCNWWGCGILSSSDGFNWTDYSKGVINNPHGNKENTGIMPFVTGNKLYVMFIDKNSTGIRIGTINPTIGHIYR